MMRSLRSVLSAVVVLAGFSIIVLTSNRTLHASDGDARERGALIFHTKGCEQCHSILGTGGDRAPDLGSVGMRRDAARIKQQIVKGGNGMPPFGHVLSKDEVKDLVTFLSACNSETAPGCRQWMPPQ